MLEIARFLIRLELNTTTVKGLAQARTNEKRQVLNLSLSALCFVPVQKLIKNCRIYKIDIVLL
jgi:hypothetical protein